MYCILKLYMNAYKVDGAIPVTSNVECVCYLLDGWGFVCFSIAPESDFNAPKYDLFRRRMQKS